MNPLPPLHSWPTDSEHGLTYHLQGVGGGVLAIDAGNTRIKGGLFVGGQLQAVWHSSAREFDACIVPAAVERAVACSVGYPEDELIRWGVERGISEVKIVRAEDPLPFESDYKTPQTLGSDRKMMVHAANVLYPGVPRLVVSVGTCITYDLITRQNRHLGGFITPGLPMRWQAMHTGTGRLPRVGAPDLACQPTGAGVDTISAMQWGVVLAIRHEIRGFWSEFKERERGSGACQLIITGGDATFFEMNAEERIFAEPNLALIGLHAFM